MKKGTKDFEKEVMELFFEIMKNHVAIVELRELYTAKFKTSLLLFAKYNYIEGSNTCYKIMNKSKTKTK
jgi:hypothetical protein